MMDEKSIQTIKIFHGIIADMSGVIESLREKEQEYESLLNEKESLKQQLEELKKKRYFGNLTSYFLVISLSMFLALPPRMYEYTRA